MNMFKRWYDADSVVSRAINELEKSSEEIQKCLPFDDKRLLLVSLHEFLIYNAFSCQIECTLSFNDIICRVKNDFPSKERFGIIFRDSLNIYDKHNFQLDTI